jgi:hypothetical protein
MVQHVDTDSDYDDASDGSSDDEYAEGDRRLRKKRPYVPKPGVEVFIVSFFQSKTLSLLQCACCQGMSWLQLG